jgi:hypothetical protein
MTAKERFNQLLDDVVAGVNDIAVEVDRSADDEFVSTTFIMLALAISRLPEHKADRWLTEIEDEGSLRQAVKKFPGARRNPEEPGGALH